MSPKGANAMERRVNAGLSVKIDKIVARRTAPVPGLAIVVIKNGQIVHLAGYGSADLETATPITPQTQFHMASCGKQFTALGIMRLKDDGKLAFDDHIGKHIPELAGYPACAPPRQPPCRQALRGARMSDGQDRRALLLQQHRLRSARLGDRARIGAKLSGFLSRPPVRTARDGGHVFAPRRGAAGAPAMRHRL
jgi:CubicO group peptidase (beta-lactamase class C family)